MSTKKRSFSKEKLIQLKKQLPEGWSITISDKAKCSPGYVSRVLNPNDKSFNQNVIDLAIQLRDEYIKEISNLEKRI
jgi:hypothetical protein